MQHDPSQSLGTGHDFHRKVLDAGADARKYKELSATIVNMAQAHNLKMPEINPSLASLKEALAAIIERQTDEREILSEHIDTLEARWASRWYIAIFFILVAWAFGVGVGFAIGIGWRLI